MPVTAPAADFEHRGTMVGHLTEWDIVFRHAAILPWPRLHGIGERGSYRAEPDCGLDSDPALVQQPGGPGDNSKPEGVP